MTILLRSTCVALEKLEKREAGSRGCAGSLLYLSRLCILDCSSSITAAGGHASRGQHPAGGKGAFTGAPHIEEDDAD